MADDRAYRLQIKFDPEGERFVGSVPELEISVKAETRAELIGMLEAEVEARVEEAATSGETLPPPSDSEPPVTEVSIPLAGPLARDLKYAAQQQNMSVDALASQLLARAIGAMGGRPERPTVRRDAPAAETEETTEEDNRNRDSRRGRGRKGGGRRREGYRPDMDDQANFLAYVRDMEKGGGRRR